MAIRWDFLAEKRNKYMLPPDRQVFGERTLTIAYWIEALLVMAAVMFLQPIDDDWFFLRYFANASDWGVNEYRWLSDNILLKRDYWRPIEDIIMFAEARHAPGLFPYLQHFLIVILAFGAGWSARCLGVKAGASRGMMTVIAGVGMLAATNLGALTSIDSLTQVSAAFWGLLSVRVLVSKRRGGIFLWIITVALACLSKESGFVFALCGPLFLWATDKKSLFSQLKSRRFSFYFAIAIALTVGYLGVYYAMSSENTPTSVVSDHIIIDDTATPTADEHAQAWDESEQSHHLTPITFVKNIAILYGLGIYPVAVSGIYYGNYLTLILTLALGWGGIVLLIRGWRSAPPERRMIALRLAAIGFYASLPSLITRAGEISPFVSNMFFIAATGVLLSGICLKRCDLYFAAIFCAATLANDGYKYSIALRGGLKGLGMGKETAAETPCGSRRIVWVGVDESRRDKAGASYNMSPYRAFGQGSAALRELGYPEDIELYRYKIADREGAGAKADSIAAAIADDFDCVWLTSGEKVKVITSSRQLRH